MTEADTVTPTIHLVQVSETDSELRSDARGAGLVDSVRAAGLPIGTRGQVWWLVAETHLQDADGSISGARSRLEGKPGTDARSVRGGVLRHLGSFRQHRPRHQGA